MGLCGSKVSKNEGKPLGASSNPGPQSNNNNRKASNKGRPVAEAGTRTGGPNSEPKLSPREAARIAAEERAAKLEAANAKSELSKKLAQERAKSRKAHVMEIAQK